MNGAVERLIKVLEAAGCQPRAYSGGAVTAHCPGPGHWRGDVHPSLRVGWGKDCALVWCHAGCATEDVLAALGLTMADLFDQPRQAAPTAPATRGLGDAIGRARGLSVADRYLFLWLLRRADWGTAEIPHRFQPRSQRELAAACGADLDTVKQATAHLLRHRWLRLFCGAPGCDRPVPHPGRGHRIVYGFPGIGDDCQGGGCRTRAQKGGTRTLLRVVGGTAITLLSVAGAGAHPPTTYHQHKTASDLRLCAPDSPFSGTAVPPFYGGAA